MEKAELTRFCKFCFVSLLCCFMISSACKSNATCRLNFYRENGKCIECPRGKVGYECKLPCPSGYFGQNCIEKCNCSKNQYCDLVSGCHEIRVTITTESLPIQYQTEPLNLTGCPKGFLQRICNTTCPSGFEGGNCNEKCNCTENQDCNSAIVCLKQNDSIYTLKTPLQYDTESIHATVSSKVSEGKEDTATTENTSTLKMISFVFIGSFCVGVTAAFLVILKSRLKIAGIYPDRYKLRTANEMCSSQYDNIEAVEDEVFLHEHSNPPTEAVDISNHVYYELSSSGLIDDNTASLTENISAEESANEYQHVSTTGHYDVLSLRNKLDPMNTNVLRLYPERPRDAYHVVNVSYLKEVNNLEDFETNSESSKSINQAQNADIDC